MRTNRAFLGVVILAAVLGMSCAPAEQRLRAVKIESNDLVASLNDWNSTPADLGSQGLLLYDGDLLIGLNSELYCQYRAKDGPVLRLRFDSWGVRLGYKVISVTLAEDSARSWLNRASAKELADLRVLEVPGSVDAAWRPGLRRLSKANPRVALLAESQAALVELLPLFRPRTVVLDTLELPDASESLRDVEVIYATNLDSTSLAYLSHLRRLRRLSIPDWSRTGRLPAGMRRLRSLSLSCGYPDSLEAAALVHSMPQDLEELYLRVESQLDPFPIRNLQALRTLILTGSECANDLPDFAQLKKLQHVGLPANATQNDLAGLIAAHPDLRTLAIAVPESTVDLTPLRKLRRLEAVILGHPYQHMEVLKELKSLRYVALPGDSTRASLEQVASLRKALPDALIVPTAEVGACLGSGWLLALVPAAAILWLVARWSRRRHGFHLRVF